MTDRPRPPAPDPAWAYFLDVDGTLVDLAPSPDAVRFAPGTREALRALQEETGGALALVSGRDMPALDALFDGWPVAAAAQHGVERRDGTGHITRLRAERQGLAAVRDGLAEFATAHPGLLLEDKGASMAMHYRLAPHCEPVVRRAMEYARVAVGSGYALQPGKLVLELKPRDAHKGLAIRAFLDEAPFRGRRPVFVADDATDEDGFAVVNALHGVTIKVGTGPSAARFGLADPRAVTRWLARGGRARRRAQAPRVRAVGAHRGGDDA